MKRMIMSLKSYYEKIIDGERFSHVRCMEISYDKTSGEYPCLIMIRQVNVNDYFVRFIDSTKKILR